MDIIAKPNSRIIFSFAAVHLAMGKKFRCNFCTHLALLMKTDGMTPIEI